MIGKPRSRRWSLGSALPMTPMIDVVFLLLIFFLVTSQQGAPEGKLAAGLELEGPEAAPSELQPQFVDVKLVDGSEVFIVGERRLMSERALRAVLGALPKEPGISIRGDDKVSVDAIARAMQAAADAGFVRRSYIAGGGPRG